MDQTPATPPATPWDDYRLVSVLARAGTIASAAAVLRVNTSTVFRRLNAVEAALGTALFERGRQGYSLTPAGEEMVALAQAMDERIRGFERRMAARDARPAGRLCVTVPESLLVSLMGPLLAGFTQKHPEIEVDLVVADNELDLSRRDADVAIRATAAPPETLVGRRLCGVGLAAYTAERPAHATDGPGRSAGCGASEHAPYDLADDPWIGLSGGLVDTATGRAVEAELRHRRIALRLNSYIGTAQAILAGVGAGYLPCWVGDQLPGIRRIPEAPTVQATGLWLLTHADLRQSPRVRAFLDHAWEVLGQNRALIEGTAGVSGQGETPDRAGVAS